MGALGKLSYLDPLAAAGGGVSAAAKAGLPKAQRAYGEAMRIPADAKNRQQVIETGMREQAIPGDYRSFMDIDEKAGGLGQQAGELLEPYANRRVGIGPTAAEMNEAGKDLLARGKSDQKKRLSAINRVERDLYGGLHPDDVKLTLGQMQAGKQDIYQNIQRSYDRKGGMNPAREQMLQAQARGYRKQLADEVPGLEDINNEIAQLRELQKHVTKKPAAPPTSVVAMVAEKLPGPFSPKGKAKMAMAVDAISRGDMGYAELILGRNSAAIRNAIRISEEIQE
jgi:hypothetical protein